VISPITSTITTIFLFWTRCVTCFQTWENWHTFW
jgi:hypothetical protein